MIMKQIGCGIVSPSFSLRAGGSTPQLRRVERDRPAALIANLFHHVLRATRSVAALAVPKTDEVDLVRAEAHGRVEHTAVAALVGVIALLRRPQLARRGQPRR